jgi:hypothetical protein
LRAEPTALRRRSWLRSFPLPTPTASPGLRLEHRLLEFTLGQKLLETGVFLLQLGQPICYFGLHVSVLLLPAVIGRLRHLNGASDIGKGLAMGDQLFSCLEPAEDLLGSVADAFHVEVPGPA